MYRYLQVKLESFQKCAEMQLLVKHYSVHVSKGVELEVAAASGTGVHT